MQRWWWWWVALLGRKALLRFDAGSICLPDFASLAVSKVREKSGATSNWRDRVRLDRSLKKPSYQQTTGPRAPLSMAHPGHVDATQIVLRRKAG